MEKMIGDLKKGDAVWAYNARCGIRREATVEERIEEWIVTTVGRKYIHAKRKGDPQAVIHKFDRYNNLAEVFTDEVWLHDLPGYEICLSKEEILEKYGKSN